MKRKDYENYIWYPIVDEGEYWVEEFPDEFPGCNTIVTNSKPPFGVRPSLYTYEDCYLGWGTMAKNGNFKFMIIKNKGE